MKTKNSLIAIFLFNSSVCLAEEYWLYWLGLKILTFNTRYFLGLCLLTKGILNVKLTLDGQIL